MLPALILNVVLFVFAGTVMDAGTVRLLAPVIVSVTIVPPDGAFPEIEVAQTADPEDPNELGVQLNDVTVKGAAVRLATPPVAENERATPDAEASIGFVT
jgi:hypothetical protein